VLSDKIYVTSDFNAAEMHVMLNSKQRKLTNTNNDSSCNGNKKALSRVHTSATLQHRWQAYASVLCCAFLNCTVVWASTLCCKCVPNFMFTFHINWLMEDLLILTLTITPNFQI